MRISSSVSFRPKHVIPAALLFVILTVAVLSSLPSVSAITQYKLLGHQMCKNAKDFECKGETHAFDAKDEYAYVLFNIKMEETGEFGGPTADWYYQSDSVEYSYTFGDSDVRKGVTWWFWNRMSIRNDKADMRGFWRVEVTGPAGEQLFTDEFTIGPFYQVRIDVGGIPETVSIPIRVDDENYGKIKGGQAKNFGFPPGTSHELIVQKESTAKEGVRWATQESTWEFSGEGSHSFTYEEQYELSIVIDPTGAVSVTGAGWYWKGATANIGQIPETVDVNSGTRFVRETVILDNQGISTPPTTITMDKPHTIKIQYRKQYYLTVTSGYGNPQGEGWYNELTSAKFSVTSQWPVEGFPGMLGAKYVFDHWSGDFTGTTTTGSVSMNGPRTVRAEWHPDYTMFYVVLGAIAAVIVVVVVVLFMKRRKTGAPSSGYQAPPAPAAAPAQKFCISCGAPLPASMKFCNRCGSEQ